MEVEGVVNETAKEEGGGGGGGADDKQHHLSQFGRTIIVNTMWDSFSRMGSRTISIIIFFWYT